MADPARARKIADRIKVIVAEYLEFRLKDERLGFVTITDARVTGDLQHASVFYTVFGSDEERKATAAIGTLIAPNFRAETRSKTSCVISRASASSAVSSACSLQTRWNSGQNGWRPGKYLRYGWRNRQ